MKDSKLYHVIRTLTVVSVTGLKWMSLALVSTAIGVEVAMAYVGEIAMIKGTILDSLEHWVSSSHQRDGTMYHPEEEVKAPPHGWCREGDSIRTLSLIGFLGKWGRGYRGLFEGSKKSSAVKRFLRK